MNVGAVNEALIESWRLSLHDKGRRTVVLYVDEVRRFARWLEAHGRPGAAAGDLLAVERRDAEAWVADLRDAGLAQATIRSRWIALRNLYRWAVEEGEVDASPLARVVVMKPNPEPVPTLSADDLRAVFGACGGTSFNDRRDLALLRLLAATGLRVSELCSVRLDDLDLRDRVVVVRHGKGDHSRVVRFDPKTAAALDRYRRIRARHRFATLPQLFIGHRGAMTRKGVGPMLDRRCAQAGVGKTHPHAFRHTWADQWLASGGTEGDLMRLGGWANSDIMRRYGAHRAQERALAAYDSVSPMGSV